MELPSNILIRRCDGRFCLRFCLLGYLSIVYISTETGPGFITAKQSTSQPVTMIDLSSTKYWYWVELENDYCDRWTNVWGNKRIVNYRECREREMVTALNVNWCSCWTVDDSIQCLSLSESSLISIVGFTVYFIINIIIFRCSTGPSSWLFLSLAQSANVVRGPVGRSHRHSTACELWTCRYSTVRSLMLQG